MDSSLANNNAAVAATAAAANPSPSQTLVHQRPTTKNKNREADDGDVGGGGGSRSGPLSRSSSKSKVECPGLLSPSSLHNNNNGERRTTKTTTTITTTNAAVTATTTGKKTVSGSKNSIFRNRRNIKDQQHHYDSAAAAGVEGEGITETRMLELEVEDNTTATSRAIVEVSNSINYMDRGEGHGQGGVISSSFLARVDPIVDFWTVDEELRGRFQIFYSSSSTNYLQHHYYHHQQHLQQKQAIIFKVKTTSPYNFLVRPTFGLMRPNVVASVEVRAEGKASLSRMEMDEFLVEIAPVPGAIAGMTSDLYTSGVSSNFPELMAVWERIESEAKNGNYEFVREFHRISCRFHRTAQDLQDYISPSSSSSSPPHPFFFSKGAIINDQVSVGVAAAAAGDGGEGQLGPLALLPLPPIPITIPPFQNSALVDEEVALPTARAAASQSNINNNFLNTSSIAAAGALPHYSLQENSSFTEPTQIECYLAREYPFSQENESHKTSRSSRKVNPADQKRNCFCSSCCCGSAVTKLKLLCVILALLLMASLLYIYFGGRWNRHNNNSTTNNDFDNHHNSYQDHAHITTTLSTNKNKNYSAK